MDTFKELAEHLVVASLAKLVKLGKLSPEQVNGKWFVEVNEKKLGSKGLMGGATLAANGRAVIYLVPGLTIEQLMHVISHEAVHLAQICRGDLKPMYGYMIWKGEEFKSLPSDSTNYINEQPWEKEAFELQSILLEHLESYEARS